MAKRTRLCFMLIALLSFIAVGSKLIILLLTKSISPRLSAVGQSDRVVLGSGAVDEHHFKGTDRHCSPGHFQLNNDGICHPMLTCSDIQDSVTAIHKIGGGKHKNIYLARWKNYNVSLVNLTNPNPSYTNYFLSAAKNLQQFQPSPFVTQLLGFCSPIPAIVTEYHKYGSLANIKNILKDTDEDSGATRFQLCLDYVKIIHFLHSGPTGAYVMCDTYTLIQTLSQFLVTSNFHVVVNDLDLLPLVNSSKGILTNCWGKVSVEAGQFAAPEQLVWSSTKDEVPGYDEKSDIWKIPAVVDYLLGADLHGNLTKLILSKLHQKCRSKDPKLRPTAAKVLKGYLDVQQTMKIIEQRVYSIS
ncbi:protein O-mannose kinase-like isoform X1 [Amphiura filiformis]|uniref:protein O-mannose kinase-like isoform X1 n=1 Tax=Amphiura filiformis TaxID=82378 RepID=UPI003B20C21C